MANTSKRKGTAEERAIVAWFRSIGWQAHRVPLSGGAEGFPGDVQAVSPSGMRLVVEAKRRRSGEGFKTLTKWLGSKDMLWLREDRSEGLVVVRAKLMGELLNKEKP